MAHRIAAYVHVAGFLLEPGDVPPPDIADQVTNPKAWTSDDPRDPEQPAPRRVETVDPGSTNEVSDEKVTPASKEVEDTATGDEATTTTEVPATRDDEVVERPAGNASADVWREFIFAVTDEDETKINAMSRSELIALADEIDAEADDE